MPENNSLPIVPFPMKIHYGEKPSGKILPENSVRVTLINKPNGNYRKICALKVMSTWGDKPEFEITDEDANKIFKDMLEGRTLPNPMEALVFDFLVENITNVESIYILRHRVASSILAKTTGERDIRHCDFIIPNDIKNSKYEKRFIELCKASIQLYSDMLDDKENPISLMTARMITPKCMGDYIYFSFNLKEVIAFINQRKCSQVQSWISNEICRQMYELLIAEIPELKNVLSLKCDSRCFWIKAPLDKNTRLYLPDATHRKYMGEYNPKNYYYGKTRVEMGMLPTEQDKE